MTEQELATYVETYLNNVTSSAQSICWFYFLAGIMFTILLYIFLNFISDFIISLVEKISDKKQRKDDKK